MWKIQTRRIGIALLLGLMCLALLLGFVPRGDRSTVRRQVNFTVEIACLTPKTPQVQGTHGTYYVGTVSPTVRESSTEKAATTPTSLLLFADGGLALITGHGLQLIENDLHTQGLIPVPNVDLTNAALLMGLANLGGAPAEVLSDAGQPLRFRALGTDAACAVSPALLAQRLRRIPLHEGTTPDFIPADNNRQHFDTGSVFARARRYQPLVSRFADRFSLDPSLVYAIIHAESSFRPMLVSSRSAMGLMQLLPSTAGGEVHKYLHGVTTRVTLEDLANPEINIRYGTAYLHLLMTRHMAGINNPLSRQYCAVASYNMGPNRFLRLFGSTREAAIEAINALTPEELLHTLTTTLPVRETRAFVAKVTRGQQNFAQMVAQGQE